MRVSKVAIYIGLIAWAILGVSFNASAETFAPNPELSFSQAWNQLFGGGDNFGTTRTVIRSIFAMVLFFFTAWCSFGLYTAYFASKSIKQHEFIIYIFRLLVILLVGMWLFNLGK